MILLTAASLLTGVPAYLGTRRFVMWVGASFFSYRMNKCSRDGNPATDEIASKGAKS